MLSEQDILAVKTAVRTAEARTRGELYCVIAEESSDYRETPFLWAGLTALAAPAILLLAGVEVSVPDAFAPWTAAQAGAAVELAVRGALTTTLALQAALFIVVAVIGALGPVRRFMTPRSVKLERARRHAQELFLARNLHQTRERTGVLIFVSLAEHAAELIADEGIAAVVAQSRWDGAMAALIAEAKAGRTGAGLVAAVSQVGDILAEHFPANAQDNPNELPDGVIQIPRL
ncbi:MAG: TPM domain-containing protein [Phenylobacterium sp.]|uniref:TPM domain-containing protein n=1 Tax=Phenylobacterium sp. TaxID=1871053 RepID=UPI0025FFE1F4|nr:TPM domain-containing protein [Phenylobacterium sp.]MCG9917636.1 TPM domain-containing protein [Phenylobacterium sp.]